MNHCEHPSCYREAEDNTDYCQAHTNFEDVLYDRWKEDRLDY